MRRHQVQRSLVLGAIALAVASQAGCYAKRKDVQAEFARVRQEMQQADQSLDQKHTQALTEVQTNVAGLSGRVDAVERDVQRLRTELGDLNVKVTRLNGLIAFDMPVHFEFAKADLRDADRAVLRRFASVVKEFYPSALITAEGYADPAGSRAFNQRLGKQRADNVRNYLVTEGGMTAKLVRTISYGEEPLRLIEPKATGPGEKGLPNRRVVLVLDYVGTAAMAAPIVMR